MADVQDLDKIVSEIFQLDSPKIEAARKSDIADFIKSAINGDDIKSHLVINSGLKNNRSGALAYVLTNRRIVKIEIDEQEVQSVSYPLGKIIGYERKLIEGNRASININFPDDSFGLRYPSSNEEITAFFQQVDQARIESIN